MIKKMLCSGCLLALCLTDGLAGEAPNFLFVISDDQSFRAIGSSGNAVIQTPNLDSLASSGMNFTHGHNMGSYSGAICVASRAMLNTGRYVWHAESAVGSDTLWAEHFEGAGYDTFISGKWHVLGGGSGETDSAAQAFMSSKALAKGFYESPTQYGRPAANPEWEPDDITLTGHWSPEVWNITNHTVSAPYTVQQHTSELYADNAIEYLNNLDEQSPPFFMYISFNAPHDPRQAPTAFQDMYSSFSPPIPPNLLGEYPYELANQRDDLVTSYPITEEVYKLHLKEYYAMISHMDAQLGRIMAALDASGKADNTYVIFTSDHGLAMGEHGYIGKQILYDHSTRMPFIMTGPGISAGSTEDAMFYMQSIVPTTLELAGIPVPAAVDFPSLTGLMNGTTNRLYDSLYGGLFADGMPQRMIRTDKYKLILYPYLDEYLLYDLENDPWEATNLLTQTTYGQVANDLYEHYKIWHADISDPYEMPFIDFSSVHVDDSKTDMILYTGSWNHIARSVSIEQTISLNNQTGAAAEFTFEGVDIRLYTQLGAGAGIFDIYLDNILVDTFDCYSPAQVDQVLAFERRGLSPEETHTIRIVNTGTKNPAGTGYNVHLDMITYNRTGVRPKGLVDRTDEPHAIITSQYSDSPAGEGHDQLFDNDSATRYTTSNNSSWVQHQFGSNNQYAVRWYAITSAQAEPLPPPDNVVSNGSFESGLTPWTAGTIVTPPVLHDGNSALRMISSSGQTKQVVSVEVGKKYRLSVWMDSSGWSSGKIVFDTYDEYDATCQFVMNASNGGWKEYTGTFVATDSAVELRVFVGSGGFVGTVYVDNVSITEVQPPPGSSDVDPASLTLNGSNDGSNWTVVDHRDGVEFTTSEQTLEFSVSDNRTAHEYYRLIATNGGNSLLQYAEIELFGYADELDDPWIPWPQEVGLPHEDDDHDGYDNLLEYAWGGNPSIFDTNLNPVISKAGNALQYIHKMRTDDPDLTYEVETTTNLVDGIWTVKALDVIGINTLGAYSEVTNRLSTENPQFYIRLKISDS